MTDSSEERFARGMEVLARAFPVGSEAMPNFRYPSEIEKDWGQLSISTVLGDVWGRPGLALKDRAIVSIAVLAATNRPGALKAYLLAGLKQGLSRSEICEILFQVAIYAGFPAAIEAFGHTRDLFDELDRTSESKD